PPQADGVPSTARVPPPGADGVPPAARVPPSGACGLPPPADGLPPPVARRSRWRKAEIPVTRSAFTAARAAPGPRRGLRGSRRRGQGLGGPRELGREAHLVVVPRGDRDQRLLA